ncbi:MAG: hypothetical protein ABH862_00320 [Candidatus Omnitrophota bacterium]
MNYELIMKLILKNKKGFTLVEVFLTASLLSIVLISIFATYTAGIRIWRTVRRTETIMDKKLFIATEKMRKEIYGYIRKFEEVEFEGDQKKLSFPAVSGNNIIEVTYTFKPGKDALIRETSKVSESLKESGEKTKTILFEAQSLKFSYLYPEETEEGMEGLGGWTDSFSEEEDGPPKAIKMEIKKDGKKEERIIFLP